jgi:hypothetical protein
VPFAGADILMVFFGKQKREMGGWPARSDVLAERGGQPPGTPKADKNQQLIPVDEISVYQQLCTSQACNRFQNRRTSTAAT